MPRRSGEVVVDTSAVPFVRMRVAGMPTVDALDRGLAELDPVLARGEPWVLLVDLTQVGLSPAAFRGRGVEWLLARRSDLSSCCRGIGCATGTPMSQALFASVSWLHLGSTPMVSFRTVEEVETWASRTIGESGEAARSR